MKGMSPFRMLMCTSPGREAPAQCSQENSELDRNRTAFSDSTSVRNPLCPIQIPTEPKSFIDLSSTFIRPVKVNIENITSSETDGSVAGALVSVPHLQNIEFSVNATPEKHVLSGPSVTKSTMSVNPRGNKRCFQQQQRVEAYHLTDAASGGRPRRCRSLPSPPLETLRDEAFNNGQSCMESVKKDRCSMLHAVQTNESLEDMDDCAALHLTPEKAFHRYSRNGSSLPSSQVGFGLLPSRGFSSQMSCQSTSQPHYELEEDLSFWKDHNMQVLVRIRPLQSLEIAVQGYNRCLRQDSCHSLTWTGQPDTQFTFDHVACETISQETLFNVAGLPMVENCMSGYNSCIFAYGQTGSGKTYTMLGDIEALDQRPSDDRGIIPRVFEYLFFRTKMEEEEKAHRDARLRYKCKCTFLEIYNEQITDLLDPSSTNLQMREDSKKGVFVDNLLEVEVNSVKDVIRLLLQGASNRKVTATNMNRESSRSHSVFTCVVESKWEVNSIINVRFGRLHLVDLAGSERQKGSCSEGGRLKEAANINKSLSTLGLVIMILEDGANGKQRHVPYRDSKLTFLLQDSLGGNSKTMIIATVSPSYCCSMETLSSLKFAQRAKFIRNNAIVNEDSSRDVLALHRQIQMLKEEVNRFRGFSREVDVARSIHTQNIDNVLANNSLVAHPCKSKMCLGTLKMLIEKIKVLEDLYSSSLKREQTIEDAINRLVVELEHLNHTEIKCFLEQYSQASSSRGTTGESKNVLRDQMQNLHFRAEGACKLEDGIDRGFAVEKQNGCLTIERNQGIGLKSSQRKLEGTQNLNFFFQVEQSPNVDVDLRMDANISDVEAELADTIASMHIELGMLKEQCALLDDREQKSRAQYAHLEKEHEALEIKCKELSNVNCKLTPIYERIVHKKDLELKELHREWENTVLKLRDYLVEGDHALNKAAAEMEHIVEQCFPECPHSKAWYVSSVAASCHVPIKKLHENLKKAYTVSKKNEEKARSLTMRNFGGCCLHNPDDRCETVLKVSSTESMMKLRPDELDKNKVCADDRKTADEKSANVEELMLHIGVLEKEIHRRDELLQGLHFDISMLQECRVDWKDKAEKAKITIQFLRQELYVNAAKLTQKEIELSNVEAERLTDQHKIHLLKKELKSLQRKTCEARNESTQDLEDVAISELKERCRYLEEELENKHHAVVILEAELLNITALSEKKIADSLSDVFEQLNLITKEKDRLTAELGFVKEQLRVLHSPLQERERLADTEQVAQLNKNYTEEKEAELKLLERTVEELERTVNALENQVVMVKRERQIRLLKEDVEMELQEARFQLLKMLSSDAASVDNSREKHAQDEKTREIEEKDLHVLELYELIDSLHRKLNDKDAETKKSESHIVELIAAASNQAEEHRKQMKSWDSMMEGLKTDCKNPRLPSVSKVLKKSTANPRCPVSPFKCINLQTSPSNLSEVTKEVLSGRHEIEKLQLIAAARQKEIFKLNRKLAEAESMTRDVIRDLLGVKTDINNYALMLSKNASHLTTRRSDDSTADLVEKLGGGN